MNASANDRPFPRGALTCAALLIALALAAASTSRLSGAHGGLVSDSERVTASRDLSFADRADGAVVVSEAKGGKVVDVLAPGTNGFARAVLRGLARERRREEIGHTPPFRLTRWSDGRLSLADVATGQEITLQAFGPTNAQAFARLLTVSTQVR